MKSAVDAQTSGSSVSARITPSMKCAPAAGDHAGCCLTLSVAVILDTAGSEPATISLCKAATLSFTVEPVVAGTDAMPRSNNGDPGIARCYCAYHASALLS